MTRPILSRGTNTSNMTTAWMHWADQLGLDEMQHLWLLSHITLPVQVQRLDILKGMLILYIYNKLLIEYCLKLANNNSRTFTIWLKKHMFASSLHWTSCIANLVDEKRNIAHQNVEHAFRMQISYHICAFECLWTTVSVCDAYYKFVIMVAI